ncbi:serine O-acetyltransferase EpsC [Saccharicrinis fermentans]|uniref:serine O-acetyltransferase n=1 Tax=Saccharicrinis fermentans DSM 9555 = JCM 21142 TaxID=869213 RepID=W7XZI7_9BACT|nr:serine O-acetyltransferase EpsC [Saccharicrinis fermentans]GAF04075.1 serine acetyltransferase [Saccharicrinis fermentans DSM 9555 = JCM 21142]
MSTFKYPSVLQETIKKLACEESYKAVCHTHFFEHPMPSGEKLSEIVNLAREVIFPGYFGDSPVRSESIYYYLGVNTELLFKLLNDQILAGLCFQCNKNNPEKLQDHKEKAFEITKKFVALLPELRRVLSTDVDAAFVGDPAAKSKGEVIFCYPAIRAISSYRIAHALVNLGVPIIPRMISEMAHSETGIDIHPKAKIGESFTIDHGTGVVIGATSILGTNVKLFQGVTLGAKSFPLDENGNPIKGIARHPIVEDDVVIYSQATILGRITIGKGSVIGGNVWVTNNVPPQSKIVQFKPRDFLYTEGGGI